MQSQDETRPGFKRRPGSNLITVPARRAFKLPTKQSRANTAILDGLRWVTSPVAILFICLAVLGLILHQRFVAGRSWASVLGLRSGWPEPEPVGPDWAAFGNPPIKSA